jgi:hypothetical protein
MKTISKQHGAVKNHLPTLIVYLFKRVKGIDEEGEVSGVSLLYTGQAGVPTPNQKSRSAGP